MKIPSLFRLPQHKRFNYIPRYYDPVKEDIANRTERIKKELGVSTEENKSTVHELHQFRSRLSEVYGKRQRAEKRPMLVQMFIAVLLLMIMYWLLK